MSSLPRAGCSLHHRTIFWRLRYRDRTVAVMGTGETAEAALLDGILKARDAGYASPRWWEWWRYWEPRPYEELDRLAFRTLPKLGRGDER